MPNAAGTDGLESLRVLMESDDQGKPGELPAFAWPGGYTMYYLTAAGDVLCPACATADLKTQLADGQCTNDDPPVAYGAIGATEDPPEDGADLACDNCGTVIYQGESPE
jgi:hypothetical protein